MAGSDVQEYRAGDLALAAPTPGVASQRVRIQDELCPGRQGRIAVAGDDDPALGALDCSVTRASKPYHTRSAELLWWRL